MATGGKLVVVSGGQTGVDFAALKTAKAAGLQTGGYAAKGYMTTDGPNLALRDEYDLEAVTDVQVQRPGWGYAFRTGLNVFTADATLRIARVWDSPGERATFTAIKRYDKSHFDIPATTPYPSPLFSLHVEAVVDWLIKTHVSMLNVAGNSEKTAPKIGEWAEVFLAEVWERWKKLTFISERLAKRSSQT